MTELDPDLESLVEALRAMLRADGHNLVEVKTKAQLLAVARQGLLRAR